jgi:hypothetical protein
MGLGSMSIEGFSLRFRFREISFMSEVSELEEMRYCRECR